MDTIMPNYKKEAAKAAIPLIKKNSTIGFGAGSTVHYLISFLNEDNSLAATVNTLTSSFTTKKILQQYGFTILDPGSIHQIDQYFDGCDQFDSHLNALKSGGGIHTMEKLLASMASEFILLGDESKYTETLEATYPLVLEVIPEAVSFVLNRLNELFPSATALIRTSNKKDGAVITEHGNYLLDLTFPVFPEPAIINNCIGAITGVLEHSLFYKLAHQAILAGPEGVRIVKNSISF